MMSLASASLNSQPIPGWAIKSKTNNNNSNSTSKDIDLGLNNSENKKIQNNSFDNAINNPNSLAEGKNENKEDENSAKAEFSESEQREIEKLKRRDREVRAHEMAHQSAGGQYAGTASYSYTTGPDNRRYAVGGSVDIETSPAKTPEETVKKADQIKRAATAPANPSSADLQIAAKATRMKMQAQSKVNQKTMSQPESENEDTFENKTEEKNNNNKFENKYLINKRNNSYQKSNIELKTQNRWAA